MGATTDYDSPVHNKFPTVFQGLGDPYAIQLKEDATPHAIYSVWNIPLLLQSKVQQELARMEAEGTFPKLMCQHHGVLA